MKTRRNLLYSLAAALLVTLLAASGALQRVDRWAQDTLFRRPGVPTPEIVIIGIDEEALAELGPYQNWDRNVMAAALEALAADPEHLPAVTAVDVLYAGNTDAAADARLAEAAAALGNVVTASMAEYGTRVVWEGGRALSMESAVTGVVEPYELLRDRTAQGHINVMADTDGILRHALLYVEGENGRTDAMAVETARRYLAARGETLKLPPVSGSGHFYMSFTGRPGAYYDGVSIARLIAGGVPAGYWDGKIVLIGPYAAALQDGYITPADKGAQMYGVEFQANVIQYLLGGRFLTEAPDLAQLAVLFALCAAAAFLFLRLRPEPGGALCAGLVLLGPAGAWALSRLGLVTHVLWLPACAVILYVASVLLHYVRTARERRTLALEKQRVDAELGLAARIQRNALPLTYPPFPNQKAFEISASMTPAREVGGDLYDYFMIDPDHLCVVIGDVSGKGVPASLFMMVALALLHHIATEEKSPAKILGAVNTEICARNPVEMFITMWVGILELSTGKLTAANAGHEYPATGARAGSSSCSRTSTASSSAEWRASATASTR